MKPIDARIIRNKPIAPDCYRMQLKPSKPFKTAIPGQFVHIRLTKGYKLLLRRPFSIYNITDSGNIEIVYQVLGKGTEFMTSLKPGNKVDILGPLGNGFRINNQTPVLVAGGVGVAGLHLLLKRLAKRHKDIYLLPGARSKDKLYCLPDLKKLCQHITIATEDGSMGSKGLITTALSKFLSKSEIRPVRAKSEMVIYACGPKGMTEAVRQIAITQKIPTQLSLEERMGCGIGFCRACVCKVKNYADAKAPACANALAGRSAGKQDWQWATVCEDGPVFEASQLEPQMNTDRHG
ncbi:MAG: dihydroorotate dehydrogenase electron transfer subunit [Planctomycetes bacterium]|nr:dihydroorotate dehydrogenase electron transfer subunit [Planctomycetota bacterium]